MGERSPLRGLGLLESVSAPASVGLAVVLWPLFLARPAPAGDATGRPVLPVLGRRLQEYRRSVLSADTSVHSWVREELAQQHSWGFQSRSETPGRASTSVCELLLQPLCAHPQRPAARPQPGLLLQRLLLPPPPRLFPRHRLCFCLRGAVLVYPPAFACLGLILVLSSSSGLLHQAWVCRLLACARTAGWGGSVPRTLRVTHTCPSQPVCAPPQREVGSAAPHPTLPPVPAPSAPAGRPFCFVPLTLGSPSPLFHWPARAAWARTVPAFSNPCVPVFGGQAPAMGSPGCGGRP